METTIVRGVHHVTAIAADAQKNYDFYTKFLGLRLVKKTVNFDDPETYHFYFGNEKGDPGTILTFFPWGLGVKRGRRGTQQVTEIGLAVPKGSLEFWKERALQAGLIYNNISKKFDARYLTILDPDGLKLELVEVIDVEKYPAPWASVLSKENAVMAMHHLTITTLDRSATAHVLTNVLGYSFLENEVNRYRYVPADGVGMVDIVEAAGEQPGVVAGGSVHHIAFRVKTQAELMEIRERVLALNLHITEKIDRNYFYSLYFREPGGVLFEIASDEPGFLVDESLENLGMELKLPVQFENHREHLLEVLPKIN